ncbi:MAG: hypothetical protein Q7R81_01970 [Candidatus Peregrinibacteria bacterium]|nr:hypothetical protein [Candidatus Peregrinibacteria bacterium]
METFATRQELVSALRDHETGVLAPQQREKLAESLLLKARQIREAINKERISGREQIDEVVNLPLEELDMGLIAFEEGKIRTAEDGLKLAQVLESKARQVLTSVQAQTAEQVRDVLQPKEGEPAAPPEAIAGRIGPETAPAGPASTPAGGGAGGGAGEGGGSGGSGAAAQAA